MAILYETVYDGDNNIIDIIEHEVPDTPDWISFRNEFAHNTAWLIYGQNSAVLASRIESLALKDEPEVEAINSMLKLMYTIAPPNSNDLTAWQAISDNYKTGIKFI